MDSRCQIVGLKKKRCYSINADDSVVRLKKIRSSSVDPSRLGHETYQIKKMFFSNASVLKRW